MRPKTTWISAGVLSALLAASAFYAARQRERAELEAAATESRIQDLTAEATRFQERIAAAERRRADSKAAEEPARSATLKAASAAPPDPGTLIKHSPRLQMLYLASQRSELGRTYGPLFQALHLSAEQIEKFEDAIIEHAGQLMDLEGTAEAQGLAPSDPAIVALRRQANQQMRAAKEAVLGAEGAQLEQEYGRTLPVRGLVAQIAGTVAFTAPLSAQQADQMTQVLAQASAAYQKGSAADWNDINYEEVDRAAVGILSSAQLAAWQQMEPMGGGPSRWVAILNARLAQAAKAAR